MSIENPLWGAPCIHGEVLKLGLAVAQSSVAKYMIKRRGRLCGDLDGRRGAAEQVVRFWIYIRFQ